MRQFGPVTGRISQMRELIRDRVIAIDAERALNITESYRKNQMVPPAIKRAQATYDVCSRMTCRVEDFELVVGNFGTSFLGSAVWPEEGFEWFYQEFDSGEFWVRDDDGVYHRDDMGTKLSITEEEKDKLIALMKTYFDLDGMELQFSIASADMLRDAQLHPEVHRDLVVRIAGFSAYFVELHRNLQNDVIRRTELDLV